jgi:hypothetical protein
MLQGMVETTVGEDTYTTLTNYLGSTGLSSEFCVGICTDDAPSMRGSLKGFVSLVKKINSTLFLNHEALVAKAVGYDLKIVLVQLVEMVNCIKSRPIKSHLFNKQAIRSTYVNLILHTESGGWPERVLLRVYKKCLLALLLSSKKNFVRY